MGSWICHLRVAEKMIAVFPDLDVVQFTFGNLAPDSGIPNADWTEFTPNRETTHFLPAGSDEGNVQDLLFFRKYVLPLQADSRKPVFSFMSGYFAHLLTDLLWVKRIAFPSRQQFAQLFSTKNENEVWNTIKEDWYGLDHLYLRDHPDSLFWSTYLSAPIPACPLPFIPQEAFEHQTQYIRSFYSHPDPTLVLDRAYPYLNETTMQRFVDEASASIAKLLRLLKTIPPPEGLVSASLLLSSAEIFPLPVPLGD